MHEPYATPGAGGDVCSVLEQYFGYLQMAPGARLVQRRITGVIGGRRQAIQFFQTIRTYILETISKHYESE